MRHSQAISHPSELMRQSPRAFKYLCFNPAGTSAILGLPSVLPVNSSDEANVTVSRNLYSPKGVLRSKRFT